MNTLGSFIESEAFFPVLILLLLLLIGVFIWVVLSDKKKEKKYREKKQNIKIDENARIKIVDQGTNDTYEEPKEEVKPELPVRTEVGIVEETIQENDIDEVDFAMQEFKKEMQEQKKDVIVPSNSNDKIEEVSIELPQAKEEVQELSEEDKKIIEAFELPNLTNDEEISDEKLEQEIIEAANEYISSIMHKDEEKEENINGKEN